MIFKYTGESALSIEQGQLYLTSRYLRGDHIYEYARSST